MFSRRPTSEDRRVRIIAFELEEGAGRGVYVDGAYTSRAFFEEGDVGRYVEALIDEGRLTLDADGENRPEVASVEEEGDLVKVVLRGWREDEIRHRFFFPSRRGRRPRMHPVLDHDVARQFRRALERGSFYDFVELLQSFTPVIEEREVTPFDGRSVHPISARTILSEMKAYSRGLVERRKREARTVILLDRSVSMANAWSLWEEHPKIAVGRFLARVVDAVQYNNVLYSFGSGITRVEDPDGVEPGDEETRLDVAMGEASLLEPERVVVITDGRPVYSPRLDTEGLCDGAVEMLDSLGRSGVEVLAVLIGEDPEMGRFYERLGQNPAVTLVKLSEGGDVVRMMQRLAEWL